MPPELPAEFPSPVTDGPSGGGRAQDNTSLSGRILNILVQAGAFLVILEPIWMVLPFAGFLYGSVLPVESLSENRRTAWLVHFVLPTHSLFPLGLVLIAAGAALFLVGATQIYLAKLRKTGLVTSGLYAWFRHPQYLALTVFGVGILLTWGRFITYLAFFIMMWLYYWLSRSEESHCRKLFGDAYEAYQRKTWFLGPGEGFLAPIAGILRRMRMPTWVAFPLSFVLVLVVAMGTGFLIQRVRINARESIPVIQGHLVLTDDGSRHVRLFMVKGPALQASPSPKMREKFMDRCWKMITTSRKIRQGIASLDLREEFTLLAFVTPGTDWHSQHHRDNRAKVNGFILVLRTPVPYQGNNFQDFRSQWKACKVVRAFDMNFGRLETGQDPVEGDVRVLGPPWGMEQPFFRDRMNERVQFFLSGL